MESRILGVAGAFLLAAKVAALGAGFSSTTPLPKAFMGHALVSLPGYLCSVGGMGGADGILSGDQVYCAAELGGGILGEWVRKASLPEPACFHAAAAYGGFVYVLGGYHYAGGLAVSDKVYYAAFSPQGELTEWRGAPPLPEPAFFLSAAVWNARIYVTGGWNARTLSKSVYSAVINSDGSLGAWRPERSLPEGVYTHAAVSNGALYVLGGSVQNGTLIQDTVYFARIEADQTLGEWERTTPLPAPLSNHTAAVYGGRIFVAGGWTGAAQTDAVHAAEIVSGQGLGAWSDQPALPRPLYMHGGAAAGGYLFIAGGSDGTSPQASVYSMLLPEPPPAPAPADALPPRTSVAFGPPSYGDAPVFVTPAAPVALSAVDDMSVVGDGAGSGVQTSFWAWDDAEFQTFSGAVAGPGEGAHWLRYRSVDRAGNMEATRDASVGVDATAPASALEAGAPRAALASGELVVASTTLLAVSAQDPVVAGAASGVAQVWAGVDGGAMAPAAGPFALPPQDGAHEVRAQARDNVGNAEAMRAWTVFVDRTPPQTSISAAPEPYRAPDGALILGAAAVLSFSAQDPVAGGVAAGVNATEYSVDGGPAAQGVELALAEGVRSVSYRSVDNVGNAQEWNSVVYAVDATAPRTTLALEDATELFGLEWISPRTAVALSAEDPLAAGVRSGVAKILYSLDGGPEREYAEAFALPPGSHVVAYRALDRAGNAEAAESATVTVGSFLDDAVAAYERVLLSGRAAISGTVRSNGPVKVSGGARIDGDVFAATVELDGRGAVSGAVQEGQPTLPPPLDLDAARAWALAHNGNAAIPAGLLAGGALKLDGAQTFSLGEGTYYLKGLRVGGQSRLSTQG
ncbi:MAG: hypothetical protein PHF00_11445, partial [Elusimicrobia bacterium]|nr:hypothetical protein [Elusimicrobiota bacterium]